MPPDDLPRHHTRTQPEPGNIARHRCLKEKKATRNRRGTCETKIVLLHDRDTFFGLVLLILQKE